MRVLWILLALAMLPSGLAAEPRRLVATELCADQWLLQLAEPREIAALSYQASLPALSVYAAEAQAFARHDGSIEAILALRPTLVLAGPWTSPRLVRALARLGVPSVRVPPSRALRQWPAQLHMLAEQLGAAPARRDALLAQLPPSRPTRREPSARPRVSIYHAGGYGSGAHTLAHDMVEAAGGEHVGAPDAAGWVPLPLERLLAAEPDLLILDAPHETQTPARQLAGLMLQHRALRRLRAQTPTFLMPEPAWLCLTPRSFLAKERLARVLSKLAAHAPETRQARAPSE